MNEFVPFMVDEERRCPVCETPLNSILIENPNERPPTPDDLFVCYSCGTALEFTDTMDLEVMAEERIAALSDADRTELNEARLKVTGVQH